MMKIYVASSWRNPHHNMVVKRLRDEGHDVYDFKDAEGFHWRMIDPAYESWKAGTYVASLEDLRAEKGFARDFNAIEQCNALVMVMPCGLSSGIELGYATGLHKLTYVYVPEEYGQPDLMVKIAVMVTSELNDIVEDLIVQQFRSYL